MILLTGGAGYVGSHTYVELIDKGYDVVIVDNLSNSELSVIKNLEKLTNKEVTFYEEDICNLKGMKKIFNENEIDSVIHFAGFKAVGESCKIPIEYYHNNITGTVNLCRAMQEHNVKNLIFSSSATVYGELKPPLKEDMILPRYATNPYGYTKVVIEQMFMDLYESDPDWSITLLRYFNPVGAHESGIIGENPKGTPNNLMPCIIKAAKGEFEQLNIFGDDFDTHDGTGIRDYIHVVDLAKGHIKAMEYINNSRKLKVYNLGTGKGCSVLELIKTFEKTNGTKIPYKFAERRKGDIAECFADVSKAKNELNWTAEKSIEDMCRDSWQYQKNILE